MKQNDTVLVVGATSSMAQVVCRELAMRGYQLVLVGRDETELELLAADLRTRSSASCRTQVADMAEPGFSCEQLLGAAGAFNHALIALGDMGDGADDAANLAHVTQLNYLAPAALAAAAASRLAESGGGVVALVSSVAGDRGRASNYVYGSAKAALSSFASGLRNRYAKLGVHVLTIKPGFVDTPMTWGMTSPLIASRERVARDIVRAMETKRDILYTPWFWRLIMGIIQHIPERVFKKLKL
ncbi:MAG: SDR family NAD(P)-dependent oxidoreductase [Alphaproteobacteria bacterium]|nr:SDR family NAD(P)-dependent oxidoreductase [Alphaproteobacteria bacterium]